ncbi:MAG: DUF2066 domain-containing protein [Alphaproteobacteria bacterium]
MLQLRGRLIVVFSAFLGALVLGGAGAGAEPRSDVFAVRDVAVDATAATAAAARDRALATGQRLAFTRLLARLTLKRDARQLPKVGDAALADLTEGFEVQEEKHSPVRYIAKLIYRFKLAGIEELLRSAGVAFAETPSKPVLVLPVLRTGGSAVLWEDPNPWRTTWANQPPADGLVPFIAPVGDINDIADIGAQAASSGDAPKLAAIMTRYGAGSVLVLTAAPRMKADGSLSAVDLAASRYGSGSDAQVAISSLPARPGETLDVVLGHAADQVEAEIGERWKMDNLLHFDEAQEAVIAVPIASLDDWVKVRGRLDQVASVKQAMLVYLSRSDARIDVQYLGGLPQLKLALVQHDLLLTEEGEGLMLRLAASAAGPPATAAGTGAGSDTGSGSGAGRNAGTATE